MVLVARLSCPFCDGTDFHISKRMSDGRHIECCNCGNVFCNPCNLHEARDAQAAPAATATIEAEQAAFNRGLEAGRAEGKYLAKAAPDDAEVGRAARNGIYVASRASVPERGEMWRSLRADGCPIISTWIDEDGEGQSANLTDLWVRIVREVSSAKALILYAESADMPLKGALIEVGIALGRDIPVFAVLPGVVLEPRSMRPVGSWLRHPKVRIVDSVNAARAAIAAMKGGAG